MNNRISNIVFAFFASLIGAGFIYAFYASPMRERVENKLYDIRTRLALGFSGDSRVVTVSIDDATVRRYNTTDPDKGKVSYDTLTQIVSALRKTQARNIAVLLLPQANPYSDPGLAGLTALAKDDPRVVFGTFGLTLKGRGRSVFPESMRPDAVPVFKADILRDYRREVIRSFTVWQKDELPFLPWALAVRYSPERILQIKVDPVKNERRVQINYRRGDAIPDMSALQVLAGEAGDFFDNKIVIVGYSTFHPWNSIDRESSHANSPWQDDGDDVEKSLPVTKIIATVTSNMINGSWLKGPPLIVNIVQTTLLTVFGFVIWRMSVGFASILFIGTWSLLLILHALIFKNFAINVPLADSLLLSCLATIAGAMWRLRLEALLRLEQEAKIETDAELARIEDRFLNRFTEELATLNQKTRDALGGLAHLSQAAGTTQTAYTRAVESNNELSEYLIGIRQFAALQEHQLKEPELSAVNLSAELDKIVRQFDARCQEQKVTISVQAAPTEMVQSDATLLRQIIYNLVSNAVKYSPENSTVTITVTGRNGNTTLSVRDHGPGIAREFQDKIFEKFYRIKDDRVYKIKGHGLGLYLSRYFAGIIGASLGVRSEPGEGSEFTLTMKQARGQQRTRA